MGETGVIARLSPTVLPLHLERERERGKTRLPRMMSRIVGLTHNTSTKEFPKEEGWRGPSQEPKADWLNTSERGTGSNLDQSLLNALQNPLPSSS